MTEKQQRHPHHHHHHRRRRLGDKKPSASTIATKRMQQTTQIQIPAAEAEERDAQNNNEEQLSSASSSTTNSSGGSNDHHNHSCGTKINTPTHNNNNSSNADGIIISAAQMAHLRKLRTRRLQQQQQQQSRPNKPNDKSQPHKMEHKQQAVSGNKKRHHHHHHHHYKRQSPPHNNKNVLQVDEVIKAARKRYGNVNDNSNSSGGDDNTKVKGGKMNSGAAGGNKEILRNKRNKVRQQTKKQLQQHEKKHYGDKQNKNNHQQKVRRGNYNRVSAAATHVTDDDDDSPSQTYCDKVTDDNNIQHENDTHNEEKKDSESQTLLPSTRPTQQQQMETQRRHGIKVQTIYDYNEEDDCENVECNLDYVDMVPDQLYRYHFYNRLDDDDDEVKRRFYEKENGGNDAGKVEVESSSGSDDDDDDNSGQEEFETKVYKSLGKNGWHRLLELLNPTPSSSVDDDKLLLDTLQSIQQDSNNKPTPFTQHTVMSMLENPQYTPILSEKDALRDEYEMLQREIESLEKDRVALERLFYNVETEKLCQSSGRRRCGISANGEDEEESYRLFRQTLGDMSNGELMSIPSMLWIEDVPLDSPSWPHNHNRRHRRGGDSVNRMDVNFKKLVREYRGTGLVLLTADTECRKALIEHCYYTPYKDEGDDSSGSVGKPTLRVDGVAAMIHGGGEHLRFCGIIGGTFDDDQQNKGGTSYFLKIDGSKTRSHGLPSNLMNRLSREMKEVNSIRYLSTGSLLHDSSSGQSDGEEERCYYLEFDSGECWWHVPAFRGEHDHDLERIFSEVDIHRVAFGSSISEGVGASASWIVIGKDGSVFYRNIPQGLHDTLAARDMEESHSAPCEISLGISGSYFIRFLDGSVDYNLPKFAADVFEKLESQGLQIRNVSLHVDTVDCLMRFQ